MTLGVSTTRDDYLRMNHGVVAEAAAYLALRLTRDDHPIPTAVLIAREVFPEVPAETILFINRWPLNVDL